jgi:hypothetical protein
MAAAGLGVFMSSVLWLIVVGGGLVLVVIPLSVRLGLLAATAAGAVLVRVHPSSAKRDAVGPRSAGRIAVTAALAGAVVVAGLLLGPGGAQLLKRDGLGILLLDFVAVPAALTVPAYGVVGCLGAVHLDRSRISRPGQVTRLALRDAIAAGLFAALVFAVIVGAGWAALVSLLSYRVGVPIPLLKASLVFIGPLVAPPAFAYWFLWAGGRSLLQLLALRMLLRREGTLPWRAVEFLEEMTRLGLLRRAGSGYLFPHRLFMEHFAAQAEPAHAQPVVEASVGSRSVGG